MYDSMSSTVNTFSGSLNADRQLYAFSETVPASKIFFMMYRALGIGWQPVAESAHSNARKTPFSVQLHCRDCGDGNGGDGNGGDGNGGDGNGGDGNGGDGEGEGKAE